MALLNSTAIYYTLLHYSVVGAGVTGKGDKYLTLHATIGSQNAAKRPSIELRLAYNRIP